MPTYFHVTSSLNRQSIEENGLDWKLMGATHGVAGGSRDPRPRHSSPEADGIFLCQHDWGEVQWFAEMAISAGHPSVDVWEVDLPSNPVFVEFDTGYEYYPDPIPRAAIKLVKSDWSPAARFDSE